MILTVAQAVSYIGLTTTPENMALMVAAADAAIKGQCGVDIEQATYGSTGVSVVGGEGDSGYYNGTDSRFLYLRQAGTGCPVTSVTSVHADETGYAGTGDDAFNADTLLTVGEDYYLDMDGCLPGTATKCSYKGVLVRLGDIWRGVRVRSGGNLNAGFGHGQANIKVVYTSGFPTVPSDLVSAACQLVSWLRNTAEHSGLLESERMGHYEYTLAKAIQGVAQIGSVKSIIGRYKRRLVA